MKRALISVSDKRGLVPFAKGLKGLGFEIIATGGTAKALKEKNISAKTVSEITGFREILGGRVKTLHPAIFGGILALRNRMHLKKLAREDIRPIDLVVVNLYPFKKRLESMDIGGAALIRSAVKNFENVGVVIDPGDYKKTIDELRKRRGNLSLRTKENLAKKAFAYILKYDRMVYGYLISPKSPSSEAELLRRTGKVQGPKFPRELLLDYEKVKDLRYGENPHQRAALYQIPNFQFPIPKQLWGKELSFNNILDLDVALNIVKEFKEPAAVVIKHTNPCGVARDKSLVKAYQKAGACDPVSAFGGVVGLNRKVDIATAREITSTFIEAVIAPGFTFQGLKVLRDKKNLRVVQCPCLAGRQAKSNVQCQEKDLRTVEWGLLVQDRDIKDTKSKDLKIVTKRKPTKQELKALFFAWKVAKYVKSNAIVIGSEDQTLGIGAGQTSRIDAVKIALSKMSNRSPVTGHRSPVVMASDGFFPFRDSIDEVVKAKVSAIIQPGGSIRDKEVIKTCDEHNIAMVFTGIRHFRH